MLRCRLSGAGLSTPVLSAGRPLWHWGAPLARSSEYSGEADIEHLPPNRAEEFGHEEATDTREAGVLEREPGAAIRGSIW